MRYSQGNLQDFGGQGNNMSAFLPYELTAARVAATVYKQQMGEIASLERSEAMLQMAYLYEAARLLGYAGMEAMELKQIANQASALQKAGAMLGENNPFVPGSGMEQEALETANALAEPMSEDGGGVSGGGKEGVGESYPEGENSIVGPNYDQATSAQPGGVPSESSGESGDGFPNAGSNVMGGSVGDVPKEQSNGFAKTLSSRADKQEDEDKPTKNSEQSAQAEGGGKPGGSHFPEGVDGGNEGNRDMSADRKASQEDDLPKQDGLQKKAKKKKKPKTPEQIEQSKENVGKHYSALRQTAALKRGGVKGMAKEATKQVAKKGSTAVFQLLQDFGYGSALLTFGLSLLVMVIGWDILWFLSFVMGYDLTLYQKASAAVGTLILIGLLIIIIGIIYGTIYAVCQTPGLSFVFGIMASDVCSVVGL